MEYGMAKQKNRHHSPVDIASVANFNNVDDSCRIIDGVNDPIVALPETIKVESAREISGPNGRG
jgi:hypothetical protein